ncbi:MAG TPA: polysaccharide pyruvyl transferase family protein [Pyrinomonadaceae bacterium]|nr:polysaccharide pyruvyl transferase family protein [Pyrinomonadaceae bacterium]
MKILITNIVTLNAGDAAILYAMIDVLRAAFGSDTEFVVYDKHGDAPARYYPELEFRKLLYLTRKSPKVFFKLGRWAIKHNLPLLPRLLLTSTERRDLVEYKNADLIVSSGGTYLVENYSLAARIFDYQISLYFEKPLVFFTQSLGPFADPSNRKALTPIFEQSIAILVRDELSSRNLADLGASRTRIHVAADAAFALSDLAALESAKLPVARSGRSLRVAISVREWRHFKSVDPAQGMKQYIDALRAVSRHLVNKHDAEITYLSTCQGMPEYWTDDSKLAQQIVDGQPETALPSVSVDSSFHHPAELAKMLKNYDLVIATRMHMAIIALSVGTPVLPIAYEFKMQELFERLGQARWVQDMETLSPDTFISAVDQFLDELPELRGPLFTAVERERASAAAAGEIVKHAYDEWRQVNHR